MSEPARISDSPMYAHLWGTPESRAVFGERARLQGWLDVLAALARALADHRGGNGELRLRARHAGGTADLVLGRDFILDAELASRIERLPGIAAVRLTAAEPARLALVS